MKKIQRIGVLVVDDIAAAIGLFTTASSFFNKVFGGQVYGADFQYRKQKLEEWINAFKKQGLDPKYINQAFLQQILFENSGWQNDVQQYLGQLTRYLNGQTNIVASGEKDFTSYIISYVQTVKQNINAYTGCKC